MSDPSDPTPRPAGPRRPPRPTGPARPPRAPRPPQPGAGGGSVTFTQPVPTAADAAAAPARRPGPAGTPPSTAAVVVEEAPAPKARRRPPAEPGETPTGRIRRVRAEHRQQAQDLLPKEVQGSSFRKRYGVPYDTQGPKVRMGVLWAIAVVASLAPQSLRPWGLAVLYGVVAGAAASQVIDAHRGHHHGADRWIGALGGSGLAVAATLGTQALGVGYLVLVPVALVAALATPERGRLPIPRAGHTVLAAGVCGGAAASLVLLASYEIGALIILLVFVMVYDASDFIVGSGASNGIEGPLAGMLFIGAMSALFAVVSAPPFNDNGADIWSFSVLAMLACPAGQIVASAMLPRADAHAPALRRLDTMLVVAPAWAGLIGLYLSRVV